MTELQIFKDTNEITPLTGIGWNSMKMCNSVTFHFNKNLIFWNDTSELICFIICIIYVVELQKSFKLICSFHLNSCFCFNTINKVEGPLERENVYSLVSWSFFVYIYIYYRAKSLSILSHLFFCTFAIFSYFLSSVS